MQPIDWLIIIFPMLGAIAWLQNEASGNIGNRPYSSWYETHFLVERKGICKLIYFKPKHFGRYTLFEVACFFIDNPNYEFIKGDIKELDVCLKACEGVDFVLNQAAWGSVPRSIEMPLFYCANNIQGTLNMLEAARQCGVKKFVYASSSSVYGDEAHLPKREGVEGNLLSPYALTKRCDEEWAKQYTKHYGLDTYGMRYFNVFGRRQDPHGAYAAVIPKFIKQLLNNEQPTINGDGKQSRDFTYIENVIEANLKACLASSEYAGEAFNIAYGGREYLIDIYYSLTQALGKDIEPIFGPDRKGDIKHSNADISKAQKMLGYDPDYDFARGLNESIEWYKNNL